MDETRLTKRNYIEMYEEELLGQEAYYTRLKEIEDVLYDSPYVERMFNDLKLEREVYNRWLLNSEHDPDNVHAEVTTAEVLAGLVVGTCRYYEDRDSTYFYIENSPKYGIDFGVRCKTCTREEYKQIVYTTIAALEQMAFNIEGYGIDDCPDEFALEDIKQYLVDRETQAKHTATEFSEPDPAADRIQEAMKLAYMSASWTEDAKTESDDPFCLDKTIAWDYKFEDKE